MVLPRIPTFEELLKKVKLPKVEITEEFDATQLGFTPPTGWKSLSDGSLLSSRGITWRGNIEGGKLLTPTAFKGDKPIPLPPLEPPPPLPLEPLPISTARVTETRPFGEQPSPVEGLRPLTAQVRPLAAQPLAPSLVEQPTQIEPPPSVPTFSEWSTTKGFDMAEYGSMLRGRGVAEADIPEMLLKTQSDLKAVYEFEYGLGRWGTAVGEFEKIAVAEPEKLLSVAKVFGQSLLEVPQQWQAARLQATQGIGGASVTDRDQANMIIQEAQADIAKFAQKIAEEYPGSKLMEQFAQLPQNIAFSLTSMGAGGIVGLTIGIGGTAAATALAGPTGGASLTAIPFIRAAAWGAGSAASGVVAYNMTSYQIMQQYLEMKNEEMIASRGSGITAAEEKQLKAGFEAKAREYGLWEAVPEAISNLLFAKFLMTPLLRMGLGRNVALGIVNKLTGIYGQELLTETITQKGQSAIEVEAGLREGKITWTEALKEIAPQTFLLTTILGGVGSVGVASVNKVKSSLKTEVGTDHPLYQTLLAGIDERLTEVLQEGAMAQGGLPSPTVASVAAKIAANQVLTAAERQLYANQSQEVEAALKAQVAPEVAPTPVTEPVVTPEVTPTEGVIKLIPDEISDISGYMFSGSASEEAQSNWFSGSIDKALDFAKARLKSGRGGEPVIRIYKISDIEERGTNKLIDLMESSGKQITSSEYSMIYLKDIKPSYTLKLTKGFNTTKEDILAQIPKEVTPLVTEGLQAEYTTLISQAESIAPTDPSVIKAKDILSKITPENQRQSLIQIEALEDELKGITTVTEGVVSNIPIQSIRTTNNEQTLEQAITNVKDGLIPKTEGNVLLTKNADGTFTINDGFHRIAQAIINGEDRISAEIRPRVTLEAIAPKPSPEAPERVISPVTEEVAPVQAITETTPEGEEIPSTLVEVPPPPPGSTKRIYDQIKFEPNQTDFKEKVSRGWHKFNVKMVDDLFALKKLTDQLKKGGVELSIEENPYLLARLLRGVTSKATAFIEQGTFGKQFWKMEKGKAVPNYTGESLDAILSEVKEPKKWQDFSIYLTARRSVELSNRGIETGIDITDAQASITELEQVNKNFPELAQKIYKYQDSLLVYSQEMGLISKELLVKLRKYGNYVPFYRVFNELQAKGLMGKKMANIANPIKRMKGSEREIINPLESIVKNTYVLVSAAEQNQVGIAMANLVDKYPDLADVFERVKTPMARVAQVSAKDLGVEVEGMTAIEEEQMVDIFRPSFFVRGDEVTVLIDGKKQYFKVDTDLRDSLLALNRESLGMIGKILGAPARWLRAGATLSPDFMFRNPARDQLTAYAYSNYGFIPGVDFIKGLASMLKKDDAYQLFRMSGGEHSMLVSMDREYLQKTFKQVVEGHKFTDYVKNPMELFRIISEAGEKATRLGEFKKGIKSGAVPREAGYSSRVVSLDFAQAGTTAQALNTLIAFFNANIRGWGRMGSSFKEHPFRTSLKVFLGITLPSILLWMVNHDDERWEEIPQWQKDIFWIVFIGDNIYRIPKPFELGIIFGSIPERFLDWLVDKDPDLMKTVAQSLIENGSPGFIPTAGLPILEWITNYSFFRGRAIVPESRQDMPPELQYTQWTSEVSKKLGELLKLPPAQIDNLFFGWTGGLGRYAVDILGGIMKGTGISPDIPEPSPTLADLPVIKAFVVRNPYGSAGETVNDFYNQLEKYEAGEKYLKEMLISGETGKYNKYKAAHPELFFFADFDSKQYKEAIEKGETPKDVFYSSSARYLRRVARQLSELSKKERLIYKDPSMTPKEKRKKIDEIAMLKTDVARQALDLLQSDKGPAFELAKALIPQTISMLGGKDEVGLAKALKQAKDNKVSPAKIAEIKAKDWTHDITTVRGDISDAISDLTKEQIAELDPIVGNYSDFKEKKDVYDGLGDKEQIEYLKDDLDFRADRVFWGDNNLVTIPDLKTAEALEAQAEKYDIPLDMIPAFQKTDSGKERIPSDRDLWESYFTYYDLPGTSYLNMTQAQVDAGKLPEEYRQIWDGFQKLKTDKVKDLYKRKYREASYSKWREDFRRANTEFDQWLIDQEHNKPLAPKAISRTRATIAPVSARIGFGAVSPRRATTVYPKFKKPSISTGVTVRAPSVPGF